MESRRLLIVLLVVTSPSAAEEVGENLNATVGGSITLPAPVLETGFLLYGRTIIASVAKREIRIFKESYSDRLHWNPTSGLFTVTGLQRTDSRIYTVDPKEGGRPAVSYTLTVYDPVAPPAVRTLTVSPDSCLLLCSADKAEETTLLWYRGEEVLNQSSSAASLPLTVQEQDFSSSYSCVAANPAEKKTRPVDVRTSCRGGNGTNQRGILDTSDQRHRVIVIVIGVLVSGIVGIVFAVTWKWHKKRTTTEAEDCVDGDSDVQYTDVRICTDRHSQAGNLPDPPGAVDCSDLTTVYDKLEAHRIVLPGPADHV